MLIVMAMERGLDKRETIEQVTDKVKRARGRGPRWS